MMSYRVWAADRSTFPLYSIPDPIHLFSHLVTSNYLNEYTVYKNDINIYPKASHISWQVPARNPEALSPSHHLIYTTEPQTITIKQFSGLDKSATYRTEKEFSWKFMKRFPHFLKPLHLVMFYSSVNAVRSTQIRIWLPDRSLAGDFFLLCALLGPEKGFVFLLGVFLFVFGSWLPALELIWCMH